MTSPQPAVTVAVAQLVQRLRAQEGALQPHEALALRLDAQFPGGDVGVLSAFFLNLVCFYLHGPHCGFPSVRTCNLFHFI